MVGCGQARAQVQAAGERPEVGAAELQVEGKAVYLVGVWIGDTVSTSPSLHKPELDGDHPAYAKPLSAERAPGLGVTSAHPPLSPLRVQRATGWFTAFDSFDDVAAIGWPTQTPGLWCDWVKFIDDRYVEVLRRAKAAILSVDRARPLYFVDQPSVSTTYLRCNGIDPVKVDAEMDVVGMEGGVPFGMSCPRDEADPMAVVFGDKDLFSHALYLDMARALGKPVVNTETYCGRILVRGTAFLGRPGRELRRSVGRWGERGAFVMILEPRLCNTWSLW